MHGDGAGDLAAEFVQAFDARDEERPRPAALRSVLTGAAPLSPALAAEFMDSFGDCLYNGYGSSEVGIATIATPGDLRSAPGTVGRPVHGTTVRILDESGMSLIQAEDLDDAARKAVAAVAGTGVRA